MSHGESFKNLAIWLTLFIACHVSGKQTQEAGRGKCILCVLKSLNVRMCLCAYLQASQSACLMTSVVEGILFVIVVNALVENAPSGLYISAITTIKKNLSSTLGCARFPPSADAQ